MYHYIGQLYLQYQSLNSSQQLIYWDHQLAISTNWPYKDNISINHQKISMSICLLGSDMSANLSCQLGITVNQCSL